MRELIDRLEETLSLSWGRMYECAKAYWQAQGDLGVSSRFRTEDGIPLGNWIFTQRVVYNGEQYGHTERRPDRAAETKPPGMWRFPMTTSAKTAYGWADGSKSSGACADGTR